MPRPQKSRNICQLPIHNQYGPIGKNFSAVDTVKLGIDELETIRLLDFENYNQDEAAKQMNVARTTIQRIYDEARKKVADALVNGKKIMIEGGKYLLCEKDCSACIKPNRLRNMECMHKNGG